MRNLKRALSLLLSSTLVLGMMVMGGSAAGYQDVDDSNVHQEAIEVLQAVGIMTGKENGDFDPDGSITRNEMAVVMAHLLNLDYDYYRGSHPFTDVPDWAAPYVAACAAEGVVAGIGNGLYGGNQQVTAAQASLMLMKALGYFQNQEDFGTDWQVATIRQASYINLFDNINSNAESALTRAQVAQLVLNALESDMVSFTGDKGIQIGNVTVGYKAEYTSKTSTDKKYNTLVSGKTDISNQGQYYIQLGEELYEGQLRKADGADVFDRPAYTWSYKGEKIGTYVDWTQMVEEYTTAVTGKELYNLLTASTIKDYGFHYYVDGKESTVIKPSNMISTNAYDYDTTDNGALTQVFVDNVDEEIVITTINTYMAKADADYNAKRDELSVSVYANKNISSTVKATDVEEAADVKEGDMLLVNVAETSNNKYEVAGISEPQVISNVELTKYSAQKYLVADGTQYDYAMMGKKDVNSARYGAACLDSYDKDALKNPYNLYLDAYGYVIGTEIADSADQYLFLTGYDRPMTHLGTKTAEAAAIFLDGTMTNIEVNVDKTDAKITAEDIKDGYTKLSDTDDDVVMSSYNKWFTYTVNSDGVYTLTPVDNWLNVDQDTNRKTINSSSVVLRGTGSEAYGRAYGNDDSVYITVKTTDNDYDKPIVEKVDTRYTGVQNVDIELSQNSAFDDVIFACYDSDGYVIGAVVLGDDAKATGYAYGIDTDAMNEYVQDKDDNYYWDFEAVVDGEVKTLTVKAEYDVFTTLKGNIFNAVGVGKGAMLELTYDEDGYVVDADVLNDWDSVVYGNHEFKNAYKYTEDFDIYQINVPFWPLKANVAGNTLYFDVTFGTDNGLAINAGAPIVVIQDVYDGSKYLETEVETYTSLNSALKSLAWGDKFVGQISAVLDDKGVAEYLVLNSALEVQVETDDGSTPDGYTATVNTNTLTVTVDVPKTWGSWYNTEKFLTAAVEALDEAGYEVTDMERNGRFGTWEFTVTNTKTGTTDIHFDVTPNFVSVAK